MSVDCRLRLFLVFFLYLITIIKVNELIWIRTPLPRAGYGPV